MDQIANMVTSIKNASAARLPVVCVPYSKLKHQIAEVLRKEGMIGPVSVAEEGPQRVLEMVLIYQDTVPVINDIQRVSKPSRRWYVRHDEIPHVLSGIGIAVISTSKGLMTDKEARRQKIGGEVICKVW
jgi:small subunit ribosomal protein S8